MNVKELNWVRVRDELISEAERYLDMIKETPTDHRDTRAMLMLASYITYSFSRAIAEGMKS